MNPLTFLLLSYCLLQPCYNVAQATNTPVTTHHTEEKSKEKKNLGPADLLVGVAALSVGVCVLSVGIILLTCAFVAQQATNGKTNKTTNAETKKEENTHSIPS